MAANKHQQPPALSRTRAPFSIRYAPQVLETNTNANANHGAFGGVVALHVTADESKPPTIRAVAEDRKTPCIDAGVRRSSARNAGAMPSLHAGLKSGHGADHAARSRVAQMPAKVPRRKEVNGEVANRKALIRLMKSPDWLVTAQKMNSYRPERMLTKIINAMNGLVDIIRRLEIVERQLMDLPFSSEYEQKHATHLSKALLSRWQELGEALVCFDDDSHRALYMVSHSGIEMADVIYDVQELLRLQPQPHAERLSVASSSLSPGAYRAYGALQPELIEIGHAINAVFGRMRTLDRHLPVLRGDGIRRRRAVVVLPAPSASAAGNPASGQRLLKKSQGDAFSKLGRPTSLICATVRELFGGLQEAGIPDPPILEALGKCADRLDAILPGDPAKKWETQLHRGRHWFMIANVRLQALNANPARDMSAISLLAEKAKIAQYVIESFSSVINIALELTEGSGMKPNLKQPTAARNQKSSPAATRPTVRWRPGTEVLTRPQSMAAISAAALKLPAGARVGKGPPDKPSALFEGQGKLYESTLIARNSAQSVKANARRPEGPVAASGDPRTANPYARTREMVSYYSELERRASINTNT